MVPQVLYPAVQLPSDEGLQALCIHWQSEVSLELGSFMRSGPLFVSINRFERKKVSFIVSPASDAVMCCAVQIQLVANSYQACHPRTQRRLHAGLDMLSLL